MFNKLTEISLNLFEWNVFYAVRAYLTKNGGMTDLASLALSLLAVPATSAVCERAFSTASGVLRGRYALSDVNLKNQIIIKMNKELLCELGEFEIGK